MKYRRNILVLLFLFPLFGKAQLSKEFVTGFKNTVTYGYIESVNDSTLWCAYYTGKNDTAEKIVSHLLRKSDLSIINTGAIWNRNNRFMNAGAGVYFQHSSGNDYYLDVWLNDSNTITSNVSISYLNTNRTPGTHLFTKHWPGMQIKGVPQIIGDSLYVLVTPPLISDTVFIEIYDLQGNLAKRRYFNLFTIFGANVNGLYHSTQVDSLIVVTTIADCSLIYLNRYTLDNAKTIPVDGVFFANHEYGSFETQATFLSKDHISQFGNVSMLFGISTGNINIDEQLFYYRRTWAGDSVYLINLGPKHLDNDAMVFWEDTTSAQPSFIAAGRVPSSSNMMPALPNQVLIYRHNQFSSDSLLLFGSNNHLPRTLFGDSNRDLYMFSTFTLTNTTGETKGVLTKIPAYLIELIEEKKVSPNIVLYPNPTTDLVRFELADLAIQNVEIYTQEGRFIRNIMKPDNSSIHIADLPPNLYVFILNLEDGTRISSIIIKQ